jgi:hypothetical protein
MAAITAIREDAARGHNVAGARRLALLLRQRLPLKCASNERRYGLGADSSTKTRVRGHSVGIGHWSRAGYRV